MREFRRWLTRAALWVLGVVTLLAVLLFIFRAYLNQVGTKELVQATARLDREDAGWTLDAIELSREKTSPPLEQNSSPLVLKAADTLGAGGKQGLEYLAELGGMDDPNGFAAPAGRGVPRRHDRT